ncbi:hypothetical protein ABZV77_07835 [Streptomyces sp. NPDC004732]|uniref:hypothetical protein n=1 Tax=Streptomyces sp. NPDC004732 TaxID=3154290 RepID=UPI0033AE3603
MYNLLATDAAAPGRIAAVLASAFGVDVQDVDVADALGDPDARNWDAPVSCEYTGLRGHLAWSYEIHARESVAAPPAESALARQVAAATGAAVLFPAEGVRPSAYWAAVPDGRCTRARLYEPDDETPTHRVDAVESPVPQLPDARVTRIHEVADGGACP